MGSGLRRNRRRNSAIEQAIEQLETRVLLADLFGSFLDIPDSSGPGSTINVRYQVTNGGPGDTPDFHVNFYLSNNGTISGADVLLGGADISVASNANSGVLNKSVTLPATNDPFWAGGGQTYFIGMIIDTNNTVSETNENNNANIGQGVDRDSAVLPPTFDLSGDFFDAPAAAGPGNTVDVTYQIRNSGTGATAPFHVDWYLSTDSTIGVGDILLNGIDTSVAGNSNTGHQTNSLTLPGPSDSFWQSLTNQTYYIGMLIDTGNTVDETNEANNANVGQGSDLDSLAMAPMDLQGDFFDAPVSAAPGQTIAVTYEIANVGSGPTPTFHVEWYLSNNLTISTSDALLASADTSLAGNASTGHQLKSLTLPAANDPFWNGILNGTYYIGMIIDTTSKVVEIDENNNQNRPTGAFDRDSLLIDGNAPTVSLLPITSPTAGSSTGFSITYSDNVAIRFSTVGGGDIRVTGPNGYNELAGFVSASPTGDSSSTTVIYNIQAPDGGWDSSDNGTYTVSMVGSAVIDTANTPVAAGTIGTFTVNIAATPPTIASLAAAPDPVTRPSDLTLTANTVAAPGSSINKVEFYRDSNNNGLLDLGTDILFGSDTDSAGGWSLAGSTLGFPLGANRYFARAQNSDGFWSNVVSTSSALTNKLPTVESLDAAPAPVIRGNDITLTANNPIDVDGSIAKVEFYRDSNGNGTLEVGTDVLLGSDTSATGGWTLNTPSVALSLGTNRFFARATDNDGGVSTSVTTTLLATNAAPTIASLSPTPDPVLHSQSITLTADGVADVDGSIALVEFYRDVNKNGLLDLTGTTPDLSLGSDTSSTGGWTFTGSAAAFPFGDNFYLAQAKDNEGKFSALVTAHSAVEPVSITPNPVTRGQNIILTANTVSNTSKKVEFYCDTDNDGLLDLPDASDPNVPHDELLGDDTSATGGWNVIHSTAGYSVGTNRFFARASDNSDVWGAASIGLVTINNVAPVVASLTDSPDPVVRGKNNFTLTAVVTDADAILADADGRIAKVEFFRDSNDSGTLDPNDALLGTDIAFAGGWTWTGDSVTFKLGTNANRFFARATDADGGVSAVVATMAGATNASPTIATLSGTPNPVVRPATITLTANTPDDVDGTIAKVEFYRDTNGNETIEIGTDVLLGSDTSSDGDWKFTGSSLSFPPGLNTYLARAQDDLGAWSIAAKTTGTVTNVAPAIESLSPAPEPVVRGQNITLTANNVTDTDGTIAKVEFYRDLDGDGVVDVGVGGDVLLGTDTSSTGGWTFTGSTALFSLGVNHYIARAQDNNGGLSNISSTTGTITDAPPVIASLVGSPDPQTPGKNVTITANASDDDTVSKVEFYRDTNNDGDLDLPDALHPNDPHDELLKTDTDGTDGWNWTGSAGSTTGTVRYFARAQDNKNVWSTTAIALHTVAQPCAVNGVVYNDLNGNRRKDAHEPGLSTWRVYVDENTNGRFDAGEQTVPTDKRGRWRITPDLFGTTVIRIAPKRGWKNTAPRSGAVIMRINNATCFANQLFGVKRI